MISANDWDVLQALAKRVGLKGERVGALRRRLEDPGQRPGRPYTLLLGRPECGIELLLRHWLGPAAEDALAEAGGRPLVLGPTPREVQPKLGRWPTLDRTDGFPGHLIALRVDGPPAVDTIAQLGSLGFLDQAVLVTRLAQPMSELERSMVGSAAAVAATGRVLVVALPGEVEQANEAALVAVTEFAQNKLREAGFNDRDLGVGSWLLDRGTGSAPSGMIADPGVFLRVEPKAVREGRAGMVRRAVAELLGEIRQRAATAVEPEVDPVLDIERSRLALELATYLAGLGRAAAYRIEERQRAGHPMTNDEVRAFVLNSLEGWAAYIGVEGFWMHYVEQLRPGAHQALMAAAREAVPAVHAPAPGPAGPISREATGGPPWLDRAMVEAKRLGAALVCGLVGYAVVTTTLAATPSGSRLIPVPVPALVAAPIGYAALGVSLILGYGAARRLFHLPAPARATETTGVSAAPPAPESGPPGWVEFEQAMIAWFARFLGDEAAQPASVVEKCLELADRLGLREEYLAECCKLAAQSEILESIP